MRRLYENLESLMQQAEYFCRCRVSLSLRDFAFFPEYFLMPLFNAKFNHFERISGNPGLCKVHDEIVHDLPKLARYPYNINHSSLSL